MRLLILMTVIFQNGIIAVPNQPPEILEQLNELQQHIKMLETDSRKLMDENENFKRQIDGLLTSKVVLYADMEDKIASQNDKIASQNDKIASQADKIASLADKIDIMQDLGLKLDNDGCIKECVGVEDNWQQYGNSGGYVEVNFGDCGSIDQQMTEVISVNTWMTCDGGCFMAVGSNSLYNLTNESFRVFLNQLEWYIDPSIKAGRNFVQFAKEANYQLHYEIKGRCK